MQIIALGVFGLRKSPVASGFTIPLVICTLLFNQYCRQRFLPIFKSHAAEVDSKLTPYACLLLASLPVIDNCDHLQVLIDMDRRDEQSGTMEETYQQLHSAYCQFTVNPNDLFRCGCSSHQEYGRNIRDPENVKPGLIHPMLGRLPISGIKDIISWLSLLFTFQENPLAESASQK